MCASRSAHVYVVCAPKRKRSSAMAAPGELRSFTASDGAVLRYSVLMPAAGAAAPAAGPSTVLLLHGWSGSRRYWDTVAPLLAARGLRVLLPDLRWHGDSAAGGPAGPAHVARLGADVAELLAAAHGATEPVLLAMLRVDTWVGVSVFMSSGACVCLRVRVCLCLRVYSCVFVHDVFMSCVESV